MASVDSATVVHCFLYPINHVFKFKFFFAPELYCLCGIGEKSYIFRRCSSSLVSSDIRHHDFVVPCHLVFVTSLLLHVNTLASTRDGRHNRDTLTHHVHVITWTFSCPSSVWTGLTIVCLCYCFSP